MDILSVDLNNTIEKIENSKILQLYCDLRELDYIFTKYEDFLSKDISEEHRISVLYLLGLIKYIKKDIVSSCKYLSEALKYIELNHVEIEVEIAIKVYIYLTLCSISIKKYSEVEIFYRKAKDLINENCNNEMLILLNMNVCSEIYLMPGTKDFIAKLIEEVDSIDGIDSIYNKGLIVRSKYIFANLHLNLFNNFIYCMDNLTKGLKLAQEYKLKFLELEYKNTIGVCYIESGNNVEAIKYLEDILNTIEEYDHINLAYEITIHINIISACFFEKLYEKAEKYLNISLKYIENVGYIYREQLYSCLYMYLSELNLRENNFDPKKAKIYLNLAEKMYNKFENTYMYTSEKSYIYKLYGDLYVKINDIDKGINYYYKGLNLLLSTSINPAKVSNLYSLIGEAYELKLDFKNAIKSYKNMDKYLTIWKDDNSYKVFQSIYKKYEYEIKKESLQKLVDNTEKLEKDILIDGITLLYNRRYLDKYIDKFNKNEEKNITAILIDIDYFKKYNDNYGHMEGDKIIVEVSYILLELFRNITDHVIRYGGEEFLILIEETKLEIVEKYIKKLFDIIRDKKIEHSYSNVENYITISAGIYEKRCKIVDDIVDLLEEADKNLYKAKKTGRNNYIIDKIRGENIH